jgi:antitoxin component YwqK of YwqJK toxin-antitoxin module
VITKFKIFESNQTVVQREHYENGKLKFEACRLNGELHREDGPAYKRWYHNGQLKFEEWYLNGKKHREDGPAYQQWYENGQKWNESYYLNGIEYKTEEEWLDALHNLYPEKVKNYLGEEKYKGYIKKKRKKKFL